MATDTHTHTKHTHTYIHTCIHTCIHKYIHTLWHSLPAWPGVLQGRSVTKEPPSTFLWLFCMFWKPVGFKKKHKKYKQNQYPSIRLCCYCIMFWRKKAGSFLLMSDTLVFVSIHLRAQLVSTPPTSFSLFFLRVFESFFAKYTTI